MLRIRLRRMGARNRPFYRVVVSDARSVPAAAAIEEVGHYDPLTSPPQVQIDKERVDHWVRHGAQVSQSVARLLRRA